MSLEPPGTFPPTDAVADDSLIVDGLERALAQARGALPDHDRDAAVELPSLAALLDHHTGSKPEPVAADLAIDSSAVMNVLREAIDRYTNGDGHEFGTWDSSVAAVPTVALDAPHRHVVAGYERDRRRLAAVVVVLFILVFGFGYERFTGSSADKVTTNTPSTIKGQAVTTLGRSSTTGTSVPGREAPPSSAPIVAAPTPTTQKKTTTTEAPPAPDPCAGDSPPPECAPESTTTSTSTTTAPPVTTCTTDTTPPTVCAPA